MATIYDTNDLIPGLVNDVALEIFLHYVAIDWDGPFTLMLVCNKWGDFVVSKARLWTWISVDDCQPDWEVRAHVMATLSRDLPLQVVLRIPFHNIDGLIDATPRCRTVFLDSSEWGLTLSRGSSLVNHEEFIERREEYKELHDVIVTALSYLERRAVDAVVESADDACFSFATWTIFERVLKARSFRDQINDIPVHLITALIFEDQPRKTPRRLRLSNVWPYLPFLPYLKSLELSDNLIGVENPSNMPEICLPSLLTVAIDCATGWLFRTKGHNVDLFSLLGRLAAPFLQSMILNGSFSQVINAMKILNDQLCPSDITLSFISLGDTKRYPNAEDFAVEHRRPIWKSIGQLTLDFFDPKWHRVTWDRSMLYDRLSKTLQELLYILPSVCTLRVRGGEELEHLVRLEMPNNNAVDIFYRTGSCNLADVGTSNEPAISRIHSLTLSAGYPTSPTYLPWFGCAEHVRVEGENINTLLKHVDEHHPATMSSLDTGTSLCRQFSPLTPMALAYYVRFASLTKLRCSVVVALEMVTHFGTPQLRDLTLTGLGTEGAFNHLLSRLTDYCSVLSRLSTLAVEGYPPWSSLLYFVANFNKDGGGGIVSVGLPGHPHPSILLQLVNCLGRNYGGDYEVRLPGDLSAPKSRTIGCEGCLWGGWHCFIEAMCPRFSISNLITITKGSVIGGSNNETAPNIAL